MKILEKMLLVKDIIIQLVVILDYLCIRENRKLIAIDLTKEQAIRADWKAMKQTNLLEIWNNLGIQKCCHS